LFDGSREGSDDDARPKVGFDVRFKSKFRFRVIDRQASVVTRDCLFWRGGTGVSPVNSRATRATSNYTSTSRVARELTRNACHIVTKMW